MAKNYFVAGQWNVICDRCGLKHKSGDLREEWTGLRVCRECFETRHPQTLIRIPREEVAPDWARPESTDIFAVTHYPLCTEISDSDFLTDETGVILNA